MIVYCDLYNRTAHTQRSRIQGQMRLLTFHLAFCSGRHALSLNSPAVRYQRSMNTQCFILIGCRDHVWSQSMNRIGFMPYSFHLANNKIRHGLYCCEASMSILVNLDTQFESRHDPRVSHMASFIHSGYHVSHLNLSYLIYVSGSCDISNVTVLGQG